MSEGQGQGQVPRRAAMRANYASTTNLEKRQALNSFIVSAQGTTVHEVVASLSPASSILDVGCGNGLWMEQAAQRGDVVGVDLSVPLLVAARARSGRPVTCGDAVRLPFRDDSTDAALMLWMLYHVSDKRSALEEITRVLRPGGRLVAATNAPSEEGAHADIIRQALSRALGREVSRWLEPLDFNADNGETILREHFDSVTIHRWSVGFELPEPGPLVEYLDSGREPIEAELGQGLPWAAVLATAGDLASDHIRASGSLRFGRRGASFVAR